MVPSSILGVGSMKKKKPNYSKAERGWTTITYECAECGYPKVHCECKEFKPSVVKVGTIWEWKGPAKTIY